MAINGTLSLPIIEIISKAYKGSPPECTIMNTRNFAISKYLNYGFNNFTRFNGTNIACNQNGIFDIMEDNSLDEGVYNIKTSIKSGILDTYTNTINRIRNMFIVYESSGGIEFTISADKNSTRRYLLPSQINGINKDKKKRRIKVERGIRNRHFDFKIENINGSSIEIDNVTVTLEPIVGKRR